MTAIAEAFARARRLTRAEKRNLKRKPKVTAGPEISDEELDGIIADAVLFRVADHERDYGLKDPIVLQARPRTRTTRPDRSVPRTRVFSAPPKLPSWQTLQMVEDRQLELARQEYARLQQRLQQIEGAVHEI